MNDWVTSLQKAKKSCIMQGNLKKVHYDLEDGKEMVEEYNMDTNVLTRRAWRLKDKLGGEGEWDIEIGDPEPKALKEDNLLIKESSNQPSISRRITKTNLEWRIRNLSYSVENYTVCADAEGRCLVVRTKNKKYFKRLVVPELDRAKLLPEQDRISFSHKYNTLVITYKKPKEVLAMEESILREVNKVTPKNAGDIDCKPS